MHIHITFMIPPSIALLSLLLTSKHSKPRPSSLQGRKARPFPNIPTTEPSRSANTPRGNDPLLPARVPVANISPHEVETDGGALAGLQADLLEAAQDLKGIYG